MSAKLADVKPHCLVFLNIPRYAGGTQPWGQPTGWSNASTIASGASGSGGALNPLISPAILGTSTLPPAFQPSSISDGRVEVLGFTAASLVS